MTKILYVPTGSYLTFKSNTHEFLTIDIENLNLKQYPKLGDILNNNTTFTNPYIFYVCHLITEYSDFYIRNQLQIPVLESELEIVYD